MDPKQAEGGPGFQPAAADLEARLARIFPVLQGAAFEVETTDLDGNGWNTRSVQRLRIRTADGRVLECIEKKLGKLLGITPYEPLMQAQAAGLLARQGGLLHVPHLGVVDTPPACFLYSEVLVGPHAQLARVGARVGAGLADLEAASAQHLRTLPAADGFPAGRLDFFRPWTRWRRRYNLTLALRGAALRREPGLAEILRIARQMQSHLRALGAGVAQSPRCFSHLDLLSKNFIVTGAGLHLIDWGEARVGRFGFDAGSYLHRLLRGNDPAAFGRARDILLDRYFARLPASVDRAQVRRNLAWFLALRTLCYYLRPEVLLQHRAAPQAIEDKLLLLLAELEAAATAR